MDDFAAEMARFEAEMAGAGAFEPSAEGKPASVAAAATAPAQHRSTASAPAQPTISAVNAPPSLMIWIQTMRLTLPYRTVARTGNMSRRTAEYNIARCDSP